MDIFLSPKSKNYHALDSFVYEYVNCGEVKKKYFANVLFFIAQSEQNSPRHLKRCCGLVLRFEIISKFFVFIPPQNSF